MCTLQVQSVAAVGSEGVCAGCGVSLVCTGGQKRGSRGNPVHGVRAVFGSV